MSHSRTLAHTHTELWETGCHAARHHWSNTGQTGPSLVKLVKHWSNLSITGQTGQTLVKAATLRAPSPSLPVFIVELSGPALVKLVKH